MKPLHLAYLLIRVILLFSVLVPLAPACHRVKDGVYLLRYGHSHYPEDRFREDGDEEKFAPIAWDFFLVKRQGGTIMVDSGFSESSLPGYVAQFGIRGYEEPAAMIDHLGLSPADITDVVITHSHFDHAGGIFLFENTKTNVHMQRSEWNGYLTTERDPPLREFLERLDAEGRLHLIDERASLTPWFTMELTGGHTIGSQAAFALMNQRSFVFVGDECYMAQLCHDETPLPEPSRYSREANAAFMNRIGSLPGSHRAILLPSHDPETARLGDAIAAGIWKLRDQ